MSTFKKHSVYGRQNRTICAAILAISFIFVQALPAEDIVIDTSAAWPAGTYDYNNVLVTNNAVLTFNGSVTLNADSLTIDSGSILSAKGTGFAAGQGPGAGGFCSGHGTGAGYGGKGGARNDTGGFVYGSALVPTDLGSGGSNGNASPGKGGAGGGAIILNIGSLTVNGDINAGGTDGVIGSFGLYGGGGSGGSIYINAEQFTGDGEISSNGGYGRFGAGAGGRIIIFYQLSSFTGTTLAKGGTGITVADYGQDGTVAFIDLSNNTFYAGHIFCFDEVDSPFAFDRVILNASKISVEGSIELSTNELSLDANSTFDISGESTRLTAAALNNDGNSAIILSGGSALAVNSSVNISNSSITTAGPQNLVLPSGDIELSDGAILKWGSGSYSYDNVSLTGNSSIVFNGAVALQAFSVTIDPCCSISAVGTGYPGEQGPGVGGYYSGHGTGGGYGGKGGSRNNSGGAVYGNELLPSDLGSGGGNSIASANISGAGGGAIRLDVNYLNVNGLIASDGADGKFAFNFYGGGGSGGSVLINAKNLYGSGIIRSDGGYGRFGGGAGGRVSVYYKNSAFNGVAQAKGGNGITAADNGQDGTVDILNNIVNTAPVADAGTDQAIEHRGNVVLDGSSSLDADGDLLIYNWTFAARPAASSAVLNNADTVAPDFLADAPGTYIISLIVSDGWLDSTLDTVTVNIINNAPTASAGSDQSVVAGAQVTLNGSASSDSDGDALTFKWELISKPGESAASLSNPASVNPAFIADKPGTYILTLVVNDGFADSAADSVTISATAAFEPTPEAAVEMTSHIIQTIFSMDTNDFKNTKNKIALTNKLNVFIKQIQKGEYKNAIKKLKNDVLRKTDGCAKTGHPDRNDWIIDSSAQAQIYQPILDVIDVLENIPVQQPGHPGKPDNPGKPEKKAH